MKPQYENKVMSSFFLWFDHVLLKKGEAYANSSSLFYKTNDKYDSLSTYSAPYKPFVADSSVSGATVISGVYLNNNFVQVGQSGLVAIDFAKGALYFSSPLPSSTRISGDFGLKEFDVKITNEAEEKLLFETKYELRPKVSQTLTGLMDDETTFPVVFLKNAGGENEEAAFGGTDWTNFRIRAIVLADSDFASTAMNSLFKDQVRTIIPLIEQSEMPFNAVGGLRSGIDYNYSNLASGKYGTDNSIFVERVSVSTLTHSFFNYLYTLNPKVYPSMIDFDLKAMRNPRI